MFTVVMRTEGPESRDHTFLLKIPPFFKKTKEWYAVSVPVKVFSAPYFTPSRNLSGQRIHRLYHQYVSLFKKKLVPVSKIKIQCCSDPERME